MAIDLVSLGNNLALIDELYARYQHDPSSVDPSWRSLFRNGSIAASVVAPVAPRGEPRDASAPDGRRLSAWPLVNSYRVRGHYAADLDPLGMFQHPPTTELEPAAYGFAEADMDRVFGPGGMHGIGDVTLRELFAALRATYCGSIGIEFMHISAPVKKAWLSNRMETRVPTSDAKLRKRMLQLVVDAETLERFCHVKYPGTKRFSLEGSESIIPMIDLVLTHAARHGVIEAVIGMAHRGRLNVLAQTMGRRLRDVFVEFEDIEPEASLGGGDVKYHLGYSCDRIDENGREMHLSLAFNPSHLEAVDPVVVGRVRAKQRRHGDWEHRRVAGILIHGDGAFAGQGLVPETLNLMNLHGYRTGGTVHLIINNQIGFTATAHEARSTPYCTDVAKMIQCPIFHVNGEDLDAVAQVVEIAMDYRAQFQTDVVIDMFCYRKFGHNEMDEPSFTQPLMYAQIQRKTSIHDMYGAKLVADGVLSRDELAAMERDERADLETELEIARATHKRPQVAAMRGVWAGFVGGADAECADVDTAVSVARLKSIGERLTSVPEGFAPHRKVARLLAQRAEMARGERPIDWGMAELLAYGSLLWDSANVRISGQDSSRGTFSHRHALVVDADSGTEFMALGHLHEGQGLCRIYDSPISEAGVLGFEFGYSLDYPDALVVWEAQFGDFANGAQVIFDQFITASEDKWNRLSGLTVLLPHGYEGQGPEHSSARAERFLQSAAEDNMQICQPTTPAQMFHLLRRQVVRPYRKPLIVLTPKSLLRLPAAMSTLDDLATGRFRRVLPDTAAAASGVDRVFFCSGKLYFDLVAERERRGDTRTAIIRLEQLYPWRDDEVKAVVEPFPGARHFAWIQDEPWNMGAREFAIPRLEPLFGPIRSVTREASASPATGSHKAHVLEHGWLMTAAFEGED